MCVCVCVCVFKEVDLSTSSARRRERNDQTHTVTSRARFYTGRQKETVVGAYCDNGRICAMGNLGVVIPATSSTSKTNSHDF